MNSLSLDWLPSDRADTFSLRDYYVELRWERQIKRAITKTQWHVEKVHDIFGIGLPKGPATVSIMGR